MAWGFIAGSANHANANTTGNITVAPLAAGAITDRIVVVSNLIEVSSAPPAAVLTDSLHGVTAYSEDAFITFVSGTQNMRLSVYSLPVTVAGTPTITQTETGASNRAMSVALYTYLSTSSGSSAVDKTSSGSGSGATATTSATAATTAANELVVGAFGDNGQNPVGGFAAWAGTGFTLRDDNSNGNVGTMLEDNDSGSSGTTQTANVATGKPPGGPWGMLAVVYRTIAVSTLRPTADVSNPGSFTNELAGSTNLYASINEVTPSSTDYVQSPAAPVSAKYTFRLGNFGSAPATGARWINIQHDNDQAGTTTVTYELMQGATVLQTFGPFSVTSTTAAEVDLRVTATITDWTTPFDIRVTATQ